jgi:hypothetical protein
VRGVRATLLIGACLTVSLKRPAHAAAPTTAECLAASETSLTLRNHHKLREARARLLICSDTACPDDIRDECVRRVAEVNAAMPSVIFEAKSVAGGELTNVRVSMDGESLADQLDGTAIALDPGQHSFTFEAAGEAGSTMSLVVHEGQKNRLVPVRLGSDKASVAPSPARDAGDVHAATVGPERQNGGPVLVEGVESGTARTSNHWWVRAGGAYVFHGDNGNYPGAIAIVGAGRSLPLSPSWLLLIGANAVGGRVARQGLACTTDPTVPACVVRHDVWGGYLSAVAQVTPLGPRTRWFLESGVGIGVTRFGSAWASGSMNYDLPAQVGPMLEGLLGTGVLFGSAARWGASAAVMVGAPTMAGSASLHFSL